MGSAGTGDTPTPDDENRYQLQHEQETEDERQQQIEEQLPQPTQPGSGGFSADPARQGRAGEPATDNQAQNWQDSLIGKLSRLNDDQRAQYDGLWNRDSLFFIAR